MNELRDWIANAVARELAGATQWKTAGPGSSQQVRKGAYFVDRDVLNVKLFVGKAVQIVQWINFETRTIACISDSYTLITTQFSKDSLIAFRAEHQRAVTNKVKNGGIIVVQGCVLQFRDPGSPSFFGQSRHHVQLYITGFKLLTDGGPVFGQPKSVEELSITQERLKELAAAQPSTPHDPSGIAADMGSLTPTQRIEDDDMDVEVRSQPDEDRGGDLAADGSSISFATQSAAQKAAIRSTTIGSGDQRAKLLSLLAARTGKPVTPHQPNIQGANGIVNQPTIKQAAASTDAGESGHPAKRRKLSPPLDAPQLQLENTSPSAQEQRVPPTTISRQREPPSPGILNPIGSPAQEQPSKSKPASPKLPVIVPNARIENGISATVQNAVLNSNHVQAIHQEAPDASSEAKSKGVWEGMGRISRKDVRIPQEQKVILDHEDSWIAQLPGKRIPQANIPIHILKSLTDEVDNPYGAEEVREANHLGSRPQVSTRLQGSPEQQSPEASDAEGDSGDAATSISWSPSPSPRLRPRTELPPDSPENVPLPKPERKSGPSDTGSVSGGNILSLTKEYESAAPQIAPVRAHKESPAPDISAPPSDVSKLSPRVAEDGTEELANDSPVSPAVQDREEREVVEDTPNVTEDENPGSTPRSRSPAQAVQLSRGSSQAQDGGEDADIYSSDEDELPLAVPLALGEEREELIKYPDSTSRDVPPSTAPQSKESIIQVKRTPYNNAEASAKILSRRGTTPSGAQHSNFTPDERDERLLEPPSTFLIPGTFEDATTHSSPLRERPQAIGNAHSVPAGTPAPRNLVEQSNYTDVISPESKKIDAAAKEQIRYELLQSQEKRKAGELDDKPKPQKRRKLKFPKTLNFSQENRSPQDPVQMFRQMREEFEAGRDSKTQEEKPVAESATPPLTGQLYDSPVLQPDRVEMQSQVIVSDTSGIKGCSIEEIPPNSKVQVWSDSLGDQQHPDKPVAPKRAVPRAHEVQSQFEETEKKAVGSATGTIEDLSNQKTAPDSKAGPKHPVKPVKPAPDVVDLTLFSDKESSPEISPSPIPQPVAVSRPQNIKSPAKAPVVKESDSRNDLSTNSSPQKIKKQPTVSPVKPNVSVAPVKESTPSASPFRLPRVAATPPMKQQAPSAQPFQLPRVSETPAKTATKQPTPPTVQAVSKRPEEGPSKAPVPLHPSSARVVEWLDKTTPKVQSIPVQAPDEQQEFWKDNQAPFKLYIRAYAKLLSNKGALGKVNPATGELERKPSGVDVLSWEF